MHSLIRPIYLVILVYAWLIFIRFVLGWLRPRPTAEGGRAEGVLATLTEPYLALVRGLLAKTPFGRGSVDRSPVVAVVLLLILMEVVVRL